MYINSALNYTGNKFKLLPKIFPYFPKENEYNSFIDIFGGGGVVSVNVSNLYKKKIILNDNNSILISFFLYLSSNNIDDILNRINFYIDKYHLSKTSEYGYNFYNVSSNEGLSNYNRKNYNKLRNDYNSMNEYDRNILFYLLIVYGFNNQIRFNSHNSFNNPVGKRDFNNKMKTKLITFQKELSNKSFSFSNKDFRKITDIKKDDFIYLDPPYRISTATYNEKNSWTIQDDIELFNYLDNINKIGAKFMLSNVIEHKGLSNNELIKWSKKYNCVPLNFNYNNSNYHSNNSNFITKEVIIKNY